MWTAFWVFISALVVALVAPMIGHSIKLSEFRQAWIDELRNDIADYLGAARRWARKYDEYVELEKKDVSQEALHLKMDEVASVLNEARVIMWRIQMRINPLDNEYKTQDDIFLKAITEVTSYDIVLPYEPDSHIRWNRLATNAISESRKLLKREWDVTKRIFPRWVVNAYHAITGM